jgi:DNA-binding protein H-NS
MANAAKSPDELPSADDIIAQLTDLDTAQLARVISAAQEQRVIKVAEARDALIARVREEAAVLGLDPADLFARQAPARKPTTAPAASRKSGRGVVPEKYRSPDGGQSWSGRGKTPAWLAELEASGRKRDDFLIKDGQPDLMERAKAD